MSVASRKTSARSLREAHPHSDPAVGQDLTSSGSGEPFNSQKQLIPLEMIHPNLPRNCTMLHITHGSIPADPAAPCQEAVMGLATPRAALSFVLYIFMLYCFGAATSCPRVGFLGFYMLEHHTGKSHHRKGKASGRKCPGSSHLSGFKDGACLENSQPRQDPISGGHISRGQLLGFNTQPMPTSPSHLQWCHRMGPQTNHLTVVRTSKQSSHCCRPASPGSLLPNLLQFQTGSTEFPPH